MTGFDGARLNVNWILKYDMTIKCKILKTDVRN